jgi:hypothetical protein
MWMQKSRVFFFFFGSAFGLVQLQLNVPLSALLPN